MRPLALFLLVLSPALLTASEVTPRAKLRRELAQLGPTPAERRAAVQPTAEQEQDMRKHMARWIQRGQAGDAALRREQRRDELLERYGSRSYPLLREGLDSKAYWIRRTSAQALGILLERHASQIRWLLYADDAVSALIEEIGTGPRPERIGYREELDALLEAITQRDAIEDSDREWWTPEAMDRRDAQCQRQWRELWREEHERWRKEREGIARKRRRLQAQLARVD